MHVKHVILDGFKSYGTRVDVGTFDPHFNAITGYNGSGKSNILDGIIFVLGLSSLSHVRAQSLNDLIFKGGNVKRASVSVVFDNKDKRKSKCPVTYENYDEIIVTRTVEEGSLCKYYLNGITSTKGKITEMFESVGLNVNNPNFMIMQGKITKVVNMKPKETLAMIEETVGASVYQSKRDKAVRELEEKEKQIQEIHRTLADVVQPALRRQEHAFRLYEEFKRVEKDRDVVGDKWAISAYRHYLALHGRVESELAELGRLEKAEEDKVKDLQAAKADKANRQLEVKKEIKSIETQKLAGIEKEVSGERKKVATSEASLESAVATRKECEVKLQRAVKAHEVEVRQVEEFKKKSGSSIDEFQSINGEIETAKSSLALAQEKESEVNAGRVLGDDGNTFDLRERLVEVDTEIGKIRPKHDHETRLLLNEEKSLREKEDTLRRTPSDKEIERNLAAASKAEHDLRQQLIRHQINPEDIAGIDGKLNEASNRLNAVDRERRTLFGDFRYLEFSYDDPSPNFNRSSVHGCVYDLFEFPNVEGSEWRVAFEVGTSGSYNYVVVDTPEASKALINHGNVAIRRTYMPLSSVRPSNPVTQDQLDRKFGGPGQTKAVTALSRIKYDRKYEGVMRIYMGRIVLCDTQETAKIVAYQMKFRAITKDGDVVDCDGTMQGGTRRNAGNVILACSRLRLNNLERNELSTQVQILRAKVNNYKKNEGLVKQYDLAAKRLANLTEERQCTAYAALAADVAQLKEIVGTRKAQIGEWAKEMKKWEKEHASLTSTLESLDQVRSRDLKQAKAEVDKWTKSLAAAQKKYDAKKGLYGKMDMDIKAKEAMIGAFIEDMRKAETELEEAKADEAVKGSALEEANAHYRQKKEECDEACEERRVWDQEAQQLEAEVKDIQKALDKLEVGKIKRDNTKESKEAEFGSVSNSIGNLKTNYTHLDLSKNFEKHKAEFPRLDMKKCKDELENMESTYKDLRTKVDTESAERLKTTREREDFASNKLVQLEQNRVELRDVIKRLDAQKMAVLREAYKNVNAELGKMMTTLLPESTARLVPVTSEARLEDGVNIHVQLGGVWKESLTELSGGQRSLVALALVLSLCMYHPAPFYVLDEIDAALDLSHTQNIGVLIRERFGDTQFICVSLKDGMYTNANVLFTTHFNNGQSAVSRMSRVKENGVGHTSKYAHVGAKKGRGGRR